MGVYLNGKLVSLNLNTGEGNSDSFESVLKLESIITSQPEQSEAQVVNIATQQLEVIIQGEGE